MKAGRFPSKTSHAMPPGTSIERRTTWSLQMTARKRGPDPVATDGASGVPEGLRRPRKSAIPSPQSWADLSDNAHRTARGAGTGQKPDGFAEDQRGQIQPKDKETARRS